MSDTTPSINLAKYPVQSIAAELQFLVDRASTLAPETVVDLLEKLLIRMPDAQKQALNAAIDSLLMENRELKEDNELLKGAIAELQGYTRQTEHHGGLGDK